MLNKASLKDIKSHNRQLLLQSIISGKGISRIALSRETGLSPSTVTSLVSELLEENILIESGLTLSTGGRARKDLQVNPEYGLIAIIVIGRRNSTLCVYDMSLEKLKEIPIEKHGSSGNKLFFEITTAIIGHFDKKDERLQLAGIGLLFQEDMIESDLNVMFSTSLSADNISLKEALYTQFRVPVVGEYSANELLHTANEVKVKNSVHIALANTVLISLTIDGHPLNMIGGNSANITRLLPFFEACEEQDSRSWQKPSVLRKVAEILAMLCGMFPLDIIMLSGDAVKTGGFVAGVQKTLASILAPLVPPPVAMAELQDRNINDKMAVRMRNIILGAA
jgi:DNA-binding Lrp family transcriptional regulator